MAKQEQRPNKTSKAKGVPTPHDHFFRFTFSQREHALEFLQSYLPAELIPLLKLDELKLESGTYIDERLAEHMSDILYEVPLSTAEPDATIVSIYMLFEHKSSPEQQVLLQLLRYMYECWVADLKDGKPIRPIIPIVFYHGAKKWTIPTRFLDTFDKVDKLFYAFIPDFSYILFDTSTHDVEEIKQAILSGPLQASLLLLKYIYDQGLDARLDDVFEPLAKAGLPRESILMHLRAMLKYISETSNPIDEDKLTETVRDKFVNEEGAMNILADVWREEGFVKGREEGREEGLEAGREEGLEAGREEGLEEGRRQKQRETLRLFLEHRFIKETKPETEPETESETGVEERVENQSEELESVQSAIRRLEYVKTESELDVLTEALVYDADLHKFIDHLPPEPLEAESPVDAPLLDEIEQEEPQANFEESEKTAEVCINEPMLDEVIQDAQQAESDNLGMGIL